MIRIKPPIPSLVNIPNPICVPQFPLTLEEKVKTKTKEQVKRIYSTVSPPLFSHIFLVLFTRVPAYGLQPLEFLFNKTEELRSKMEPSSLDEKTGSNGVYMSRAFLEIFKNRSQKSNLPAIPTFLLTAVYLTYFNPESKDKLILKNSHRGGNNKRGVNKALEKTKKMPLIQRVISVAQILIKKWGGFWKQGRENRFILYNFY